MADSEDNSTEYEDIPSHILVQKQLQDLIAIQKARVARLEQNVSVHNETIRENYIPKDQYETELSSLQESLRSDYVPREHYDLAVKQLEEEKVEHVETRLKLNEVVEKLEQALAEISNLRDQVEQQKVAQEKMKGTLKSKNMQETAKAMKLQSKCSEPPDTDDSSESELSTKSEISRQCEMQEEILNAKNFEIKNLERKLQEQQNLYKKEVSEAEIEKKQQRYIAKMMEEQERKNSRATHQAVPKTKSLKR